jgi:hypothetical protein
MPCVANRRDSVSRDALEVDPGRESANRAPADANCLRFGIERCALKGRNRCSEAVKFRNAKSVANKSTRWPDRFGGLKIWFDLLGGLPCWGASMM